MQPYSTELRNNATPQENRLWYDFLRAYPVRFNRQRIIGGYIADFYCAKAKLVIELDGNRHFEAEAMEYDAIRTEYLSALEIQVLRFTNAEIDCRFQDVCDAIRVAVEKRRTIPTASGGAPLPKGPCD